MTIGIHARKFQGVYADNWRREAAPIGYARCFTEAEARAVFTEFMRIARDGRFSEENRLAAIMVIFDLLTAGHGSSVIQSDQGFTYRCGVDLPNAPRGSESYYCTASDSLDLSIAVSTKHPLDIHAASEEMGLLALQNKLLGDYLPGLSSRGWYSKVTSYLSTSLIRTDTDEAIQALLLSAKAADFPQISYTRIKASSVQTVFDRYLYELSSGAYGHPDLLRGNRGGWVGASRVLQKGAVRDLGKWLQCQVAHARATHEPSKPSKLLNAASLYTFFVAELAGGYRRVKSPFGRVTDFDFDSSTVQIVDKRNKWSSGLRYVPVAPTALRQVQLYIDLLAWLEGQTRRTDRNLWIAITAALQGDGPLLLKIENDEAAPLCPSWIERKFASVTPALSNFGRQILRSDLVEAARSDLINAAFGHSRSGSDAFVGTTSHSQYDYAKLIPMIEGLLHELEVTPLEFV